MRYNLGKWAIDKFDGKPYSAVTGLYYDFHRWYDPSIGRFISQDPFAGHLFDPQTQNPYVYVDDSAH
jgi:RHS repeat-associated protein